MPDPLSKDGETVRISGPSRQRSRQVYERDDWRCVECGTTGDLSVDHIRARSEGGTNELSNLRLLCWPCHHARHANDR